MVINYTLIEQAEMLPLIYSTYLSWLMWFYNTWKRSFSHSLTTRLFGNRMVLLEVRLKMEEAGRKRLRAFYFEHFLFWCNCMTGSDSQSPHQPRVRLGDGSSRKDFHAEQHQHTAGATSENSWWLHSRRGTRTPRLEIKNMRLQS